LLAHGLWFSPGTLLASSTTKTDCHDIAEILLKVALNTINQSINQFFRPGAYFHLKQGYLSYGHILLFLLFATTLNERN
jgi:hypothetical protein